MLIVYNNIRFLERIHIIIHGVKWTKRVTGQNGSGQNGTEKMVWTMWYTEKTLSDKIVWTK